MRALMAAALLVLSSLLLAAAPGGPTAGIGDAPDSLGIWGSAPGGSGPGGAGSGGSGSGDAQPEGPGPGGAGSGDAQPDAGSGSSQAGSGAAGGGGAGGAGTAPGSDPAAPSDDVYAFEPSWSVLPATGAPCILMTRRDGIVAHSRLHLEWELQTMGMLADPRLLGRSDRFCPAVEVEADAAGPHAAATDFIRSFTLSPPEPAIPPGIALTGLTTYLLIAGQESFEVTEDLAGWGRLRVWFANVATVVDWGDGTRTVIEDGRRGAPYGGDPDEQITHVYDLRDPDTEVVVTTLWRANWSLAGYGGAVHGLMTNSTLVLPVRSFRAVRVHPDA